VVAGDFNGDGKPDLAVANQGSGEVSVLLGKGDGTFQAAVNYGTGVGSASVVTVGDFNNDDKPDLAVIAGTGVSVLSGNGNGNFQSAVNYAIGPGANRSLNALVVGDFNGDGSPDLAAASYASSFSVLVNICVPVGIDLAVVRGGSTVIISWPFPSTGFVLESTAGLGSTNWQSAVGGTVSNNNRLEVTVPLDQQERYFRLRKP
jgi:hypothetical protein